VKYVSFKVAPRPDTTGHIRSCSLVSIGDLGFADLTNQKERKAYCVYAGGQEKVNRTLVNKLVVDTESAGEVLLREFTARYKSVSILTHGLRPQHSPEFTPA
jgi:hypothetical protein